MLSVLGCQWAYNATAASACPLSIAAMGEMSFGSATGRNSPTYLDAKACCPPDLVSSDEAS